jgi:hypothetical protein
MSRRRALAGVLVLALAACDAADASDGPTQHAGPFASTAPPPASTVAPAPPAPTTVAPFRVETPPLAGILVAPTGASIGTSAPQSTDPRVFLLGDSVLEATTSDYYDTMEPRLERLGWDPTIDADAGRNTEQAERELRRNRDDVGDTVVVLIGHNDPPSAREYRSRLEGLLEEVDDVPRVLLLTIREFDEEMAPLNGVVRSMPRRHDNVELVEWDEVVADADGALVPDRLHLTEEGAQLLATVVAGALGPAPGAGGPRR